jgi:sulfur-oxidizing protein SoxZ
METGFRVDDVGHAIPRNTLRSLVCRYNGVEIFRASLGSGIAANPYLRFFVTARESGSLAFEWVDDAGETGSAETPVVVT